MQRTALCQSYLKLASGHRSDGRPTGKTVMTVALSWSPEQDPSQPEMIAAARSFLQHMGWQEHQALFVGHNDTRHPHMHIILNRVHPETGMTLDDAWSKKRSQEWALAYEREHGRVLCHAREGKYDGKAQHLHYGEWKQRHEFSNDDTPAILSPERAEWASLKASQREERIVFWKEIAMLRRDLRNSVRDEVRREFAPEWQTYVLHKTERGDATRQFDQETRRAMRHYRRVAMQLYDRPYDVQAVRNLMKRQKEYHKQERHDLARDRAGINCRIENRVWARTAPALVEFARQRDIQYQQLLLRQREEKAELRQSQSARTLTNRVEDWRNARAELAEASREKSDRAIEQETRRRERVERYLAERQLAIQRGRDRGGREP